MPEAKEIPLNKRLIKVGGSLMVSVPDQMIKQWGLKKGDQVSISALEGGIKIEPWQPEKIAAFSESDVETYSKVMADIKVKIILDAPKNTLRLRFMGENQRAIRLLMDQLYQKLPTFFSLMGLGSVE